MTDDLISRLSETLDEVERVALKARGLGAPFSGHGPLAIHAADWNPDRVLRLVAAHRKIIAEYVRVKKMRNDLAEKNDREGLSPIERDHFDMYDMSLTGYSFAVWTLADGWGLS